jgi:hypothetical protein
MFSSAPETAEVAWHGADIVGDKDALLFRSQHQNVGIFHAA